MFRASFKFASGNKLALAGTLEFAIPKNGFATAMVMSGQSFVEGMEAVNKALYEAKRRGRNEVLMGKICLRERKEPT